MPKKDEIKVRYNITLKNVLNLGNDCEGKSYYVSWKRGTKSKNKGQTKKAEANKGVVSFGELFVLECTLLQDEKTKKFESKKLDVTFKEVRQLCAHPSLLPPPPKANTKKKDRDILHCASTSIFL